MSDTAWDKVIAEVQRVNGIIVFHVVQDVADIVNDGLSDPELYTLSGNAFTGVSAVTVNPHVHETIEYTVEWTPAEGYDLTYVWDSIMKTYPNAHMVSWSHPGETRVYLDSDIEREDDGTPTDVADIWRHEAGPSHVIAGRPIHDEWPTDLLDSDDREYATVPILDEPQPLTFQHKP